MWAPVAFSILVGHTDLAVGGLYFLGALALSWFGTGFIMNLTNRYRATVDELERAKREIERIERRSNEMRNRRADDSDDES